MDANLEASILAWASSVVAEEVSPITKVRSHEVNEVFRLTAGSKSLFLKVGPSLQREYQRLCGWKEVCGLLVLLVLRAVWKRRVSHIHRVR